jgi:hypothetical protein
MSIRVACIASLALVPSAKAMVESHLSCSAAQLLSCSAAQLLSCSAAPTKVMDYKDNNFTNLTLEHLRFTGEHV